MRHLSSALYCEGPTDARFLRPLLRRLCESVASLSTDTVEVADVLVLDDQPPHRTLTRAERIEKAAVAADGAWVVLFIHADADHRVARDKALAKRVAPGIERLGDRLGATRQAVAVVPVRATEAWVLADTDALRSTLGTSLSDESLGLSAVVLQGADRVADPKSLLQSAFLAARPRARPAQFAAYLDAIGETVALDRLRRLAAFRTLESELMAAARILRIVSPTTQPSPR